MKPLFAVIDTNVIVSASLKRKSDVDDIELSNPRKIIKYIKEDIIVPIINAQILLEYIDVLSRKELYFREATIYEIVDLFINKSIINRNIDVSQTCLRCPRSEGVTCHSLGSERVAVKVGSYVVTIRTLCLFIIGPSIA